MLKKDLRTHFLIKRNGLSFEEINSFSEKIIDQFISNFELINKNICLYLPITDKKEINTFILLDKLDIKHLFTTRWNQKNNELSIHSLNNIKEFKKNNYQILEPSIDEPEISSEIIDIIIIPLLIFDIKGDRVGYGKGIYDKFLRKFKNKTTLFIGFSFFEPIELISDKNEFDIKLTHCITTEKIYEFKK
jgi:5-formyltetrahydrofolate cyclo-ligase